MFLHDRDTGTTQRVSATNGVFPAISADGRWITYTRNDFLEGTPGTEGDFYARSVLPYDRDTGSPAGFPAVWPGQGGGPSAVSDNGRWIAYERFDTVVEGLSGGVWLYDRDSGTSTRVSLASGGGEPDERSYCPAISADGRWITYFSEATNLVDGDTNNAFDVFLTQMW